VSHPTKTNEINKETLIHTEQDRNKRGIANTRRRIPMRKREKRRGAFSGSMGKKSPRRLPDKLVQVLRTRVGQQIQRPITPHQHSPKRPSTRTRAQKSQAPTPAFPTKIGRAKWASAREIIAKKGKFFLDVPNQSEREGKGGGGQTKLKHGRAAEALQPGTAASSQGAQLAAPPLFSPPPRKKEEEERGRYDGAHRNHMRQATAQHIRMWCAPPASASGHGGTNNSGGQ